MLEEQVQIFEAPLEADSTKHMEQLFHDGNLPRDILLYLSKHVFQSRLLKNAFFSNTQEPQLVLTVAVQARKRIFTRRQMFFSAGESAGSLFLVLQGTVSLVAVPGHQGGHLDLPNSYKAHPIHRVYPYQLLSHRCCFGLWEVIMAPSTRKMSARCETRKCSVLEVSRATASIVLADSPALMDQLRPWTRRQEIHRRHLMKRLRKPGIGFASLAALTIQRHVRLHREPHKLQRATQSTLEHLAKESRGNSVSNELSHERTKANGDGSLHNIHHVRHQKASNVHDISVEEVLKCISAISTRLKALEKVVDEDQRMFGCESLVQEALPSQEEVSDNQVQPNLPVLLEVGNASNAESCACTSARLKMGSCSQHFD